LRRNRCSAANRAWECRPVLSSLKQIVHYTEGCANHHRMKSYGLYWFAVGDRVYFDADAIFADDNLATVD